jgi:hypothetical protein
MHCVMLPIVGSVYLVSYYEDIDEFCATIEIEVPQNVSHGQLQLEKFGPSAYARNLINTIVVGLTAGAVTGKTA